MNEFLKQAWFFTLELFKFMVFFYTVWLPGFLLAGILSCRFRYPAWSALAASTKFRFSELSTAVAAGIFRSAGRKTSITAMLDLHKRGVALPLAFAFLIASRNMTIHFWAIFALSLGAEFATGLIL